MKIVRYTENFVILVIYSIVIILYLRLRPLVSL